jgi:hypothetical protein
MAVQGQPAQFKARKGFIHPELRLVLYEMLCPLKKQEGFPAVHHLLSDEEFQNHQRLLCQRQLCQLLLCQQQRQGNPRQIQVATNNTRWETGTPSKTMGTVLP